MLSAAHLHFISKATLQAETRRSRDDVSSLRNTSQSTSHSRDRSLPLFVGERGCEPCLNALTSNSVRFRRVPPCRCRRGSCPPTPFGRTHIAITTGRWPWTAPSRIRFRQAIRRRGRRASRGLRRRATFWFAAGDAGPIRRFLLRAALCSEGTAEGEEGGRGGTFNRIHRLVRGTRGNGVGPAAMVRVAALPRQSMAARAKGRGTGTSSVRSDRDRWFQFEHVIAF